MHFFRNLLQSLCAFATLLTWGFCPYRDYFGCPILSPFVGERVGSYPARHHLLSSSGSLYELTVS